MKIISSAAIITVSITSCSWLITEEACVCSVSAKDCDNLEVYSEQGKKTDEKTAERPPL